MKCCSAALLLVAATLITTTTAGAQTLPAVKTDKSNKVPECATPGRLMAFMAARNATLDKRFAGVATEYMRHGEEIGIRWDYAFFQMILETGNLSFKRGNGKPGNVKSTQNNFAGLGATGGGEAGEAFPDVSTGVKAHLQHLLMYAGERVEEPVAERTRKVQEWGVLTSWHKGFKRPVTFADLAAKWAPGSSGYGRDIASVGSAFYDDQCAKPDPNPGLVAEARRGHSGTKIAARDAAAPADHPSGVDLARQAAERARAEGDSTRSALGTKPLAATNLAPTSTGKPIASAPETTTPPPSTPPALSLSGITILNAAPDTPKAEAAETEPTVSAASAVASVAGAPGAANAGSITRPSVQKGTAASTPPATTVAAATTAKVPAAPAAPAAAAIAPAKCRVWTASYGGQKSVIIKSVVDQSTNFTVLEVNEGQEARETDAYIAAYAKGGQKVGDFSSQNAALDKAFQLCPEG